MSYAELRERTTACAVQSTSLDEFLTGLAEDLTQAFCCRSVVLWTRDPMGRFLSGAAKVGLPDEALPRLRLADSSRLLSGPEQVVSIDDAELEDDDRPVLRQARAETAVLARLKGQTVGLITVGRKLSGEPLDDEDRELLVHVADQLSLAIGNLQQRREEIEFAQARQIQQSLLPAAPPEVAGLDLAATWQPAREAAGDYFDIIRLTDTRVALCIGDVVGKGMPAALLMSNLQAAVRAVANPEVTPQRLAEQVRAVVTQSLTGGRFVTFCYALVDLEARTVTWANAGHNPPVLHRYDGTVVRLEATGPAIARLLAEAPIGEASVALEPADGLVLFTDGVTEAENAAGEQLGEERLLERIAASAPLAAQDLLYSIVEAVHDHARGELGDDLTLVVAVVGAKGNP
jgi:sigma-B regulation protein RsbU (phosphoserine phosphatase)